MRLCVVADEMAGGMNAACNLRPLPHELPNHEKGRPGVVAGEDVEQFIGRSIVGAVVVGQRDFVRIGARDDRVAKDLRPRAKRSVGQRRSGGRGCNDSRSTERKFFRDALKDHASFFNSARAAISRAWLRLLRRGLRALPC